MILRPTWLAAPANVKGAGARAAEHRQTVLRGVAKAAVDEKLIGRQQPVAVFAEVVLEYDLGIKRLALSSKRIDTLTGIHVKHERRAICQLGKVAILQPHERQQQRSPSVVQSTPSLILALCPTSHLIQRAGAGGSVAGDDPERDSELRRVYGIDRGKLLPGRVKRRDVRVTMQLVLEVAPGAARVLVGEDHLLTRLCWHDHAAPVRPLRERDGSQRSYLVQVNERGIADPERRFAVSGPSVECAADDEFSLSEGATGVNASPRQRVLNSWRKK